MNLILTNETMKAKELRIGNLLYPIHLDGYAEVIEIMVSGIGIKKLGDDTQKSLVLTENEHRLEPIELTEEWLIKLGFDKFGDYEIYNIEGFQIDKAPDESNDLYWFFISDHNDELPYSVPIKHVHQLQNLYFALTGNELEIK